MRHRLALSGWLLAAAACSIAVPGADFDSAPAGSLDTGDRGEIEDSEDADGSDAGPGASDGADSGAPQTTGGAEPDGADSTGDPGAASGPGSGPGSGGGSGPTTGSGPSSGSGPAGSGGTPPPDPGPFCGDGSVDPGEVCDTFDLDGEDCESLGLGPGVLTCQGNCDDFNTAGCSVLPACGDNHADPGEQCDGLDMDGENCSSMGFDIGVLQCHDDCTYDTSTCTNL